MEDGDVKATLFLHVIKPVRFNDKIILISGYWRCYIDSYGNDTGARVNPKRWEITRITKEDYENVEPFRNSYPTV